MHKRGVAWHGSMFDVNFMLCWQCKMCALATHVESSIVKDVWHSQLKKDQARSEVGPVLCMQLDSVMWYGKRLIVACNMCPCHEREVNVCHMNAAIKFISGWVGGKLYDEKFILTPLTSPTHPEWSLRYRHSRSPIRPPCWTRSVRGVAWHGSMFDVNFMLCWQCKMCALATHVESSIVKDVWHSQLKKDQARSEVGPVFVHATW